MQCRSNWQQRSGCGSRSSNSTGSRQNTERVCHRSGTLTLPQAANVESEHFSFTEEPKPETLNLFVYAYVKRTFICAGHFDKSLCRRSNMLAELGRRKDRITNVRMTTHDCNTNSVDRFLSEAALKAFFPPWFDENSCYTVFFPAQCAAELKLNGGSAVLT